ncbi:glutaredoxin family protein [Iodobacter sp.]|uniref:glutaredoxin family protein n=1 Tax=Iodobacter sp. TaxID=1915058 RepID=UPI0025E8455C|nr:glutaredoxin family protein [Iodobacter sp.]
MGRVITIIILIGAFSAAWRHYQHPSPSSDSYSSQQINQLASMIKPNEVVMYSTTECVYCHEAKAWLNQNNVAFTECNMSIEERCQQEFNSYGAIGTPFLIVRGHHMKDGFDSDEFLQALSV